MAVLVALDKVKNNWVSLVKNGLFRCGFGFAFDYHEVGYQKRVLCMFHLNRD